MNREGARRSELGGPQASGCSRPWGGGGVVGTEAVCHFPGTRASHPQGAWARLCICHVRSGACVPSCKLCLMSDSDADGHQPHTCPRLSTPGQHTTDTIGCLGPDGKGGDCLHTDSWAGPKQNVGVKSKLSEGQFRPGGQVNLTVRPSSRAEVGIGPKRTGRSAGQAGGAA